MTISQRLMLAFLGLTLLILIATLSLARWSFEHGFLDYVNALEQTRLQTISQQLSTTYQANDQKWQNISQQQLEQRLAPDLHIRGMPLPGRRPPPPGSRPPPSLNSEPPPFPPRDAKPRPPPGFPEERPGSPPTTLFDNSGQHLASTGMPIDYQHEQAIRVPVMLDDKVVGELLSLPKRHFETPLETAFSRQQLITSLLTGLVALLLASAVAWWLTRVLLKPVQNMAQGIRRLSQGEYDTRLQVGKQDELGRLTTDINHLALTLEESRNSRRRWIADISHELRTPITILSGEIAAIQEGIRPFAPAQLESLSAEADRLRHLVDDLYQLSVSDVGGLRYELSRLDLHESVEAACTTLLRSAAATGIDVQLNSQPGQWISGDRQRIDQLLSNLLNNSLAYTESPGRIELDLRHEDGTVVLQIQDSAPGVDEHEYSKLFDPLYRRDESRSRHTAGAGLGLAICQNIVQAHRGSIIAAPSPLGGLTIRITFPEWRHSDT